MASLFCSMTSKGRLSYNHADVADTVSFLKHIDCVYQEVEKMVLDKVSWHMSEEAMKFFAARDIILIWYPLGHPYLNPVEEVWYVIKK